MKEITRELEGMGPSGAMLDLLAGVDPAGLSEDQKVTACILVRKVKGLVDHILLSILGGVSDTTELAMAIKEPEQSVRRLQEFSGVLEMLPRLSELLRRGELDLRRLEAVYERVVNLATPEMVAEVEEALVEVAPGLTRTQLARRATGLVAKVDPTGYEQRCQKAKVERRVEFKPLPDGMAEIKAVLPAVQGREIFEVLSKDVTALPKDERTTDQKRADCFLDRFLGYGVGRKVQVHVTIPIETLMGLTEDPGLLDGYGPISADAARDLAMQGPWRGLVLGPYRRAEAISTDKYRPNAPLKEFAKVRDGGTCTAPGCTTPIQELDHVTPWPKGKTEATQLKGLCSWHHHRKHDNYTVTLDPDGTSHWVTPQGRRYTTTPHQY